MAKQSNPTVRKVDIDSIVINDNLQCREKISPAMIDEYKEGYLNGDQFPPIRVIVVDEENLLVDGFTRYAAQKSLGKPKVEILASVGTYEDAVVAACAANASHGVRRSWVDVQKAVRLCEKTFPKHKAEEKAAMVGVSVRTYWRYAEEPKARAAIRVKDEATKATSSTPKPSKTPANSESNGPTVPRGTVTSKPKLDVTERDPCGVCGHTKWKLTDGGYQCCSCNYHEGDKITKKMKDAVAATCKDVDAAPEIKAVKKEYGRFIRALDVAGLLPKLEKELNAISKFLASQ